MKAIGSLVAALFLAGCYHPPIPQVALVCAFAVCIVDNAAQVASSPTKGEP